MIRTDRTLHPHEWQHLLKTQEDEIARLRQENERLQDEDRIWEKHGLVQIVWERDQLRGILSEILTELQLGDTRHDLQAKIILALGDVPREAKHGG